MRRAMRACVVAVIVLAAGSGALADVQWDVYKSVPDVDKAGLPNPNPNDQSCWMAAASNLLGGGGWGTGANAQARADNIYKQLTTDLSVVNMGSPERAINYWLYTYGLNPASNEYKPNVAYTDVTVSPIQPINSVGYDFLLDELVRCQYVAVCFDNPPHAMTLIGGNYERNLNPPVPLVRNRTQSLWHDSDRDQAGVDDNPYWNDFVTNPRWDLSDYVAQRAQEYVTLCPGLQKPEAAVRNYDVAYFWTDTNFDKALDGPGFREAGDKAALFQNPVWEPTAPIVTIFNEEVADMIKRIYLLVDYTDQVAGRQENITLLDDRGRTWNPLVTSSEDDGQLLFYWQLDYQPAWEQIVFPDLKYKTLAFPGNVKDWDVATICLTSEEPTIPEPATASLVLLSMAGLAGRRLIRRRAD